MAKKVLLIGHCGGDGRYLRSFIRSAADEVTILEADDPQELAKAIEGGVDLILLNRELGYGFPQALGVELIRKIQQQHPELKMMLVSNYPEAQAEALAAGALPGFGKSELGSGRVTRLLSDALAE